MNTITSLKSAQDTINGRRVVKKHVATIHCTNKLSLLERKISNALLYNAYPNLKKTLIHEVSLEKLKRLLNTNTRNHKVIKQSLRKLISILIEWNILGDQVPEMPLEGWSASTILSSVSIVNGVVKYQYSELIKELITDPQIYGKINLLIQSRFKSSYALALYENCARYRGLKYSKSFDYGLFRRLMGVEEGKYRLFRDFNRRVLTTAVTEINTCSDIFVTPEIMRRGRKIISIKFKIEERPMKKRLGEQAPSDTVINVDNMKHTKLCQELNIKLEDLKKLMVQYGEVEVGSAIQYLKSQPKYQKGGIRNVIAYLRVVIEKSYAVNTRELPPESSASKIRYNEGVINAAEAQEQYRQYVALQAKKTFDTLSQEVKRMLETEFTEGDHKHFSGYAPKLYQSLGINNILLFETGFADYLFDQHSGLMPQLDSLDEFKAELEK